MPKNVLPLDELMNGRNDAMIKTTSRKQRTEKLYPWQWRQKMLSHKVSRDRDNAQNKGCHSNPYSLHLDSLLDKSRGVVPKVNG